MRYFCGMSPSDYQDTMELLGDCREAVDLRGETTDRRLDALGRHLEAIERRLAALGDGADSAGWRVTPGERRLALLEHRLEGVRRDVARPRVEMFDHLDEVDRRLDRLEHDHHAIADSLQRLEGLLARLAAPREVPARGLTPPGIAAPRTL
jgi:predicted  nucleic acid-binding Zn-ribbon protein